MMSTLTKPTLSNLKDGSKLGSELGLNERLRSWRTSPLFKNHNQLNTNVLILSPERDKYITSLCRSDTSNMIAVGAGSKRNNLFLAADNGTELAWKSTFTTPSPIYSLSWSGYYILAGHWDGVLSLLKPPMEFLEDPDHPEGKETRLLIKTQYKHQHGQSTPQASPRVGKHPFSSRVQKVEFSTAPYGYPKAPAAPQFYSLCNNAMYQWDVMHSKAPIKIVELGDVIASDSSWNPHYSDTPELVAVGDLEGALRVVDFRSSSNSMVWSIDQSLGSFSNQINEITSVKWSPFVPYWIASSGNDGLTKVWDLRYNKLPMAQLSGPGGSVLSVDWSNTHTDVLMGGSSDHRCYMWSLSQYINPPPFQFSGHGILVKEGRAFTSSVVQMLSSDKKPGRFYALSDVGELGWLEANTTVLDTAAPIRATQPDLRECETLLFRRDMQGAGKKIVELLSKREGTNQAELDILCDAALGYPSDPARLALAKWQLDSAPPTDTLTPEARFSSDVGKFAYGVPIGFARTIPLFSSPLPGNFEKLASSTFSQRIRSMVNSQDLTGLLKLENEIVDFLVNGYSPTSIELVTDITRLILPKNCSATLNMTTRILDLMIKRQTEVSDSSYKIDLSGLAPLVYLILYPTVFDADPTKKPNPIPGSLASPPARPQRSASRRNVKPNLPTPGLAPRPSLRRVNTGSPAQAQAMIVKLLASHPKSLLAMIQLEIDIQAVAVRCGADSEKAGAVILHTVAKQFGVVSLSDAQPQHFTISSGALKLFLNAMIQLKRYETFLLHATVLEKAFRGCELALIVSNQASSIAAPKFKNKIEAISKDLSNEKDAEDIIQGEGFRSVLRCLLQIGVRYEFDCIELEVEFLKSSLRSFSTSYLHYLRHLSPGSGDLSSASKELTTLFQLLTLDHHVRPNRTLSLPKLTGQESSNSLIQAFDDLVKGILL